MVLFASPGGPSGAEMQADVAQLVERNLAKVEVASSSLVVRSERVSSPSSGGLAERRGNGLQIRVHGFKSRTHLARPPFPRAIGAAVARFLDTEEVTGSNPVSPTTSPQVRGRPRFGRRPLSMSAPHRRHIGRGPWPDGEGRWKPPRGRRPRTGKSVEGQAPGWGTKVPGLLWRGHLGWGAERGVRLLLGGSPWGWISALHQGWRHQRRITSADLRVRLPVRDQRPGGRNPDDASQVSVSNRTSHSTAPRTAGRECASSSVCRATGSTPAPTLSRDRPPGAGAGARRGGLPGSPCPGRRAPASRHSGRTATGGTRAGAGRRAPGRRGSSRHERQAPSPASVAGRRTGSAAPYALAPHPPSGSPGDLLTSAAKQLDPSDPSSPMARRAAGLKAQHEKLTQQVERQQAELADKVDKLTAALGSWSPFRARRLGVDLKLATSCGTGRRPRRSGPGTSSGTASCTATSTKT